MELILHFIWHCQMTSLMVEWSFGFITFNFRTSTTSAGKPGDRQPPQHFGHSC